MGFFTIPTSAKKRKRAESSGPSGGAAKKKTASGQKGKSKKDLEDEDISSEEEDEPRRKVDDEEDEEDEFADETTADKRRRLALQYLENTKNEIEEIGFDAAEIDRDLLAERLRESVAEDKGRIYRHIADSLSFSTSTHTLFRADTKSITGVTACYPYLYTISKDRHLIKWQIPSPPSTSSKPKQILHTRCSTPKKNPDYEGGHTDEIICIAASQDGKFLATGGKDNRIVIWDPNTLNVLKIFKQHRSPVMGLVFRRNTNQMYSCSADRTVKLWSLDELAYVETLFGHQDEVVGITALAGERCVTVGARDRTVRLWKIVDETQLVFRGGGEGSKKRKAGGSGKDQYMEGSIDCVAMIDEEYFVTGSDNGSISFWSTSKKKPIFTVPCAHGINPPLSADRFTAEENPAEANVITPPPQPRQITAVAAVAYSDTFFSGSYDGQVRVWKISQDKRKFECVGVLGQASLSPADEGGDATSAITKKEEELPPIARGVVNSIVVFDTGDRKDTDIYVSIALGKEMRLGRWLTLREGKNAGMLFRISKKEGEKDKSMLTESETLAEDDDKGENGGLRILAKPDR